MNGDVLVTLCPSSALQTVMAVNVLTNKKNNVIWYSKDLKYV